MTRSCYCSLSTSSIILITSIFSEYKNQVHLLEKSIRTSNLRAMKQTMMKKILFVLSMIICSVADGQSFKLTDSKVFMPQSKKVNLYVDDENKKLILFRTNLQVNTDGIPTSYHPYDLRGDSIALNSILNAVAIYRLKDDVRISNPKRPNTFSDAEKKVMRTEAYTVFEQWRDSNFDTIQPLGYKIVWKNVLIESNNRPCIFKTGIYKGYFASATALKNGLTIDKGECDCNNQVDPFVVPTLVLAGKHPQYGNNPVSVFGAKVGDLLIAYNPKNKKIVYAVIGDTGPGENLGEGSVILNMKLTGKSTYPKTRKDTYGLATDKDIVICIIPASNSYQTEKPFTQENIQIRISKWFADEGIRDESEVIDFIEKNISQLFG